MDEFPRDDVVASVSDRALQGEHPWQSEDLDQQNWMLELRSKAIAGGASESTHWIYFRSPEWTWMNECGSEGWLLLDYLTLKQHGFLLRAMS